MGLHRPGDRLVQPQQRLVVFRRDLAEEQVEDLRRGEAAGEPGAIWASGSSPEAAAVASEHRDTGNL